MKLSFDKFERYELPQVTLCNPNSRATEVDGKTTITDTVGVLSNLKGINLKLNFNAPHELSFDYYRHKSTDPIKQSFYDSIYEAIQTDRYVYLTDIGYFIISNVNDSDEDNINKKSISLKSCEENEFATAEGLGLKEGTYQLHTQDNKGLLDLFLTKTAGWTIGFIDPALLIKYDSETGEEKAVERYVEKTEVDNGYNFLYTTVQDMFECIVEPDIIKRTISVYSRVYYAGHHLTDIHIAKYNLLKHRNIEENDEDKYTALNVQGKDENLEIRAVNPTGKNVIYNFEPRYAWMSPALQDAVTRWQKKCESVEDEYLTLQQGYYAELETLFNEEQNTEVLKGELKTLEETRDAVIITVGDQQSTALNNVNAQIAAKQEEINTATSNYNSHKNTVQANYEVPISQINSDCALDLTAKDINGNIIFTADLLNELMTHIKPTDYVDEYMLVTESMTYPQRFEKAKELMDRAKSQLVKISSGKKTYSVDTRSFLFNKHFKHFSEQLCAGAIIYVETKKDTMEQLHLTGIDINFDDKSANLTLGNKYDRSDLKALYDEALGQNSKSFSELKYIAGIIEEQQKQLDYQRNWIADLRTLTLDNVLTSEDQAIEINNRGLIGRKRKLDVNGKWDFDENGNPLFDPEQVKLINNTLVFTNDNWQTAATAVGKIAVGYNPDGSVKYSYGINGQVLIGELILGNNLVLTGTGAGIKIKDKNGKDAFYADNEGNLVLSGTIFAEKGKIGGWSILPTRLEHDATFFENDEYQSGYRTGIQCISGDNSAAFYAGCKTTSGDSIANENSSNFYVTNAGHVFCNNIKAIGGKIASWQITNTVIGNALISGVIDSDSVGIAPGINTKTRQISNQKTGGGQEGLCFWAGAKWNENSDDWNKVEISKAPFRVYSDGSLYADKATITGNLKAGSVLGDGAWKMANHWLYAKKLEDVDTNITFDYDVCLGAGGILTGTGINMKIKPWTDITGSDRAFKENITEFSEQYDTFFNNLKPCRFNYNNVFPNGNPKLVHFGFIAQDVILARNYAQLENLALIDIHSQEYYGLYLEEFIALNTWQIQKAKSRITDLENTVVELKTQIQILTAG